MHRSILLPLALALAVAGCGGEAAPEALDPIAAAEGGDPIPSGKAKIDFLWTGKQSIMCVGEAFERQVAFVDFSADGGNMEVGTVTLGAEGDGEATFVVPVVTLRTGHEDRDTKLMGPLWLDADNHPDIAFESTKLERVRPTVWLVEGKWSMRGASKPVRFYANVRYMPEMKNVGKDVVRLNGSFDIALADHGVGGSFVGTPAVASTWTVELVLLGTMKFEAEGE